MVYMCILIMCLSCCCAILQSKGLALVSPRDSRVPRVIVLLASCPEGIPDKLKIQQKFDVDVAT